MEAENKVEISKTNGKLRLWLGFLLSPIAWAVQLQTVYMLSVYGCQTGNFLPIHIVSIAAFILSLIGGIVSWLCLKDAGIEQNTEAGISTKRSRFMAIQGVLNGALFSLLILAQWLPTIMGVPCDK